MAYDLIRDCKHGRLKGRCNMCDLEEENMRFAELLKNPEEHYPGNFDTPQRANALLSGLCQDAATEIERLRNAVMEERKACAKLADQLSWADNKGIASAIRARVKP